MCLALLNLLCSWQDLAHISTWSVLGQGQIAPCMFILCTFHFVRRVKAIFYGRAVSDTGRWCEVDLESFHPKVSTHFLCFRCFFQQTIKHSVINEWRTSFQLKFYKKLQNLLPPDVPCFLRRRKLQAPSWESRFRGILVPSKSLWDSYNTDELLNFAANLPNVHQIWAQQIALRYRKLRWKPKVSTITTVLRALSVFALYFAAQLYSWNFNLDYLTRE